MSRQACNIFLQKQNS